MFESCQAQPLAPIPVRGLPFLAGSASACFPPTIAAATELVTALQWRGEMHHADIAQACRKVIDQQLASCGALLLRGLPLENALAFNQFFGQLDYPTFSYNGGIAVRGKTAEFIYEASQEPPAICMTPHNEMAYLPKFPGKVFFYCEAAAPFGGEVPLNDVRASTRLLDPALAQLFRSKGIAYTRRLAAQNHDAEIGWQQTFQVQTRAEVEALLCQSGFEYSWQDNGDLVYGYQRPAFIRHGKTGEELWFNQVTELHGSYWMTHPLYTDKYREPWQCPANTTFGDGSPIAAETINYLRGLIWQTSQFVKMQPGEVLVLDNTLIQHGRMPYQGYRRHVVSLTS